MGNRESRNGRDMATFHQGLELLGRGALLVAESSPQLLEHWEQVTERLQRVETNMLALQHSVDRVQEQLGGIESELARLRDNDRDREVRLSALETCIDRAVVCMFPRVDALLTQLESAKNINTVTVKKIVNTPSSSASMNSFDRNELNSNIKLVKFDQKGQTPVTKPADQAIRCTSSYTTCHAEPVSPSENNHPIYEEWGEEWVERDNALLDAAKEGRAEDVHFLIATGANINTENLQQRTPLMLAAYEGHAECLSILLQAGADVDCRDMNEFLPLHAAACRGHESAVRVLVEAGVDINARDGVTGSTALVLAASKGHAECVFTLLQNNAIVDVRDDDGMTALHRAVMYGHARCVTLLLELGADVSCLDQRGWSPRDYALRSGTEEIRQLLLETNSNEEEGSASRR